MCAVSDAHEYWSEWKRLHVGKVGDELSRLTSGDGKLEEASAQAARHLVDRVKIIASLRNYQELLSAAFTASEAESLTGALIPVSGSGNVSVIELEQWIVNGLDSSGDRVNVRKVGEHQETACPYNPLIKRSSADLQHFEERSAISPAPHSTSAGSSMVCSLGPPHSCPRRGCVSTSPHFAAGVLSWLSHAWYNMKDELANDADTCLRILFAWAVHIPK